LVADLVLALNGKPQGSVDLTEVSEAAEHSRS